MRYIKPDFYDRFACTADRCPDTCCAGWQIMIDEDSLEKYGEVPGSFGKRLRNSIDWEEGCFYQYDRRCAFLNERNLCDLYLALGEEGFCDTCRNYPRHTEEFEGLREYSLSLSCPVAAEMILSRQGMPGFIIQEDEEEDELEDEFEDFDLMLFTQLEDARNAVFARLAHVAAGNVSLQTAMEEALALAERMQVSVEEGRYFEIEELIEAYRSGEAGSCDMTEADVRRAAEKENAAAAAASDSGTFEAAYHQKYALFQTMKNLERLREEWSEVLEDMERTLYSGKAVGEGQGAAYGQICGAFETYLNADAAERQRFENIGLQLFVFFTYTYFCGAVYDGWVYSKMALAVRSVEFIRELLMARWKKTGKLAFEDYLELSYRYAREIEHSDQNLDELEEIFMDALEKR